MIALQSEFQTHCNLLNSKSVSDTNRELQYSNLLLTKEVYKEMNFVEVPSMNSGRLYDL